MRRFAAAVVALVLLAACGGDTPRQSALPRYVVATTTPNQLIVKSDVYEHTRAGDMSPAVAGVPTRVYVPNSENDTVSVIDPTTYAVVDEYRVGRHPQHITPAWDFKTLYTDDDIGNTLTPIDPVSGKPSPPIPVDDPYNLYFTPDGTRAIVIAERMHRIDFRDPHTWQLIKTVAIPYDGADHADFSADGKTMVISCEFSGWVVRIDVDAMALTGELHIGGQPIDVKLSPDGGSYYVANQKSGGVNVIDAATFEEVRFIKTGAGAHGLYPSRDGLHLYVTNRLAGSVTVLDFWTGKELTTWKTGGSPDMGGVTADGRELWLSGRYDKKVYVLDTRTGDVTHRIDVGRGPHGLAVFPQPGRYSLGHTGNTR